MSGAFVLRQREILREMFGAEVQAQVAAALSPDTSRAVLGAHGNEWVPVAAVEEFFVAAARATKTDVATLHERVGGLASERTIRTVWRVLMRLTSDAQLMSQVPVLYRKAWNRGTLTGRMVGTRDSTLELVSWPDVPEFTMRGVKIAVAQALALAGRRGAIVTYRRTPDGASFAVRWS
ncbi:MAG TPA: hypothetical protein VHE30_00320 [Polyangiaceae bacterium]|nr:hypothetical protein [Polyangiaceae bacterium]